MFEINRERKSVCVRDRELMRKCEIKRNIAVSGTASNSIVYEIAAD